MCTKKSKFSTQWSKGFWTLLYISFFWLWFIYSYNCQRIVEVILIQSDRSFIVINMKLLMPSFSFVVLHIFISLNTFKNVPKDFPSICALKYMSVSISASWNIYFSLLIICKYRFTCLSMPVTFWLINLIKIYLIRILRGYLLRANTYFFKIIMILIYTSFMITDKMGKNDLFWLIAQWILHSDIEGSFDCVLMFSATYYCIDLMAAKTYICDPIFL